MSQKTVRNKPRLNKKYRFQLLHLWLIEHFTPCKVLDVGGGKGLLTYLLNKSGWESVVVDPQTMYRPLKYRDLKTRRQVKISKEDQESIPRINKNFASDMCQDFDLIVGMHAHGCNIEIINACKKYDKNFVLLPCCVIDEPIVKEFNVNWFESLLDYAEKMGFDVSQSTLNFKGQNVLFYTKKEGTKKYLL